MIEKIWQSQCLSWQVGIQQESDKKTNLPAYTILLAGIIDA
jgi:hypothetical protein